MLKIRLGHEHYTKCIVMLYLTISLVIHYICDKCNIKS